MAMHLLVLCSAIMAALADPLIVDKSKQGEALGAIGGLSGSPSLYLDCISPDH